MTDIEKLQGVWNVATLEVDGREMAGASRMGAKISIRGDRFVSTGMGAVYEGTVKLDAAASPKTLNMHFSAGPEAGNTSYGIYDLDDSTWRICITTRGSKRPSKFATAPGTGDALEVLRRESSNAPAVQSSEPDFTNIPFTPVPELEGEWTMVSCKLSGDALDKSMVKVGRRLVEGYETSILFGPQLYAKAKFTIDRTCTPNAIDYFNTHGSAAGKQQLGIFELKDDRLTLCLAAPGDPRPGEFASASGDGRTLAVWKRK